MVSWTEGLWITISLVGVGERPVIRSGGIGCVLAAWSSISWATLVACEDSGGVMLSDPKVILSSYNALGLKPSPDEVWVMVLIPSEDVSIGVGAGLGAGFGVGLGGLSLGGWSRRFSSSVSVSSRVMSAGSVIWIVSVLEDRELVWVTRVAPVGAFHSRLHFWNNLLVVLDFEGAAFLDADPRESQSLLIFWVNLRNLVASGVVRPGSLGATMGDAIASPGMDVWRLLTAISLSFSSIANLNGKRSCDESEGGLSSALIPNSQFLLLRPKRSSAMVGDAFNLLPPLGEACG
jgi:hypothetical protein